MFSFLDIQVGRVLTDDEVLRINYIIKSRAFRYIAAANEDDLYPECLLTSTNWKSLNERYLLMPDPRSVGFVSEMFVGYEGGYSEGFDEYGHRPSQRRFSDKDRRDREWNTFQAFKGEYARLYGPARQGAAYNLGRVDKSLDSDSLHQHHLELEKGLPLHVKARRGKRASKR